MPFINNKYFKWYNSIINRAQSQDRKYTPNNAVYEKHHIIPKSLGGNNKKTNLVLLTYKEHFLCHLLLTKCVIDCHKTKMYYALLKMSKNNHHPNRYNSRLYSFFKEKLKVNCVGANNPNYGVLWSADKKERLSEYLKLYRPQAGSTNPMYGKSRPDLILRNTKPKTWITNGAQDKLILKEEKENYLENGWKTGRSNIDKVLMSKNMKKWRNQNLIPWNKK